MPVKKIKKSSTAAFILNKEDFEQKPAVITPFTQLKTMAAHAGFLLPAKQPAAYPNLLGFRLDAHQPAVAGKASLSATGKSLSTINGVNTPYYYLFNQTNGDPFYPARNNDGKIIIHFEQGFTIDNGFIFIRVGCNRGYFTYGSGSGYWIKIGNRKTFYAAVPDSIKADGNHPWVSQTIPILFYTPPATKRLRLPDIEITCDMPAWKFFSADYNEMLIKAR